MRGRMLWFNTRRDVGFIVTDEDERLSVCGPSFVDGKRPQGRCAQAAVTFEIGVTRGKRQAEDVVLVEEKAPRRARLRRSALRAR
jgi:cold shock CspA family protein